MKEHMVMTLDLDELLAGWNCATGEICARVVSGRGGTELIQLRVDLGVMQMFPDGRPDGLRYHGFESAYDFIKHELNIGASVAEEHWRELERELYQVNYRRLALASLAEDALAANDPDAACAYLERALRDISESLLRLKAAAEHPESGFSMGSMALRPTLVFHGGRLSVQLRVAEQRFEEAVEQAALAADALDGLLAEIGLEEDQRAADPGIAFLLELEQRLRSEYGIPATLRERLADALDREDFETAAQLRDELSRRGDDPAAGDLWSEVHLN